MKIDWMKLKAAIHKDTAEIRNLKRQLRCSEAHYMKLQATRHHAIAAHMRRHTHLSGKFLCNPHWISDAYGPCFWKPGMTLDEQAKFIEKELQNFILPEEALQQSA